MYRKRERTQNWSLEEKLFLLDLVKSRLDVLENKRIDSASSAMKGLAWQDIHAGFAARFGNDRDAHRVREQWRRMKGQSRTEMLEFAERVRTYGAEMANQRRPSALAEEVWKTLEMARRLNVYQQTFGAGAGDDLGSPANLDDDEDGSEDISDVVNSFISGPLGLGAGARAASRGDRHENGFKAEMDEDDVENASSSQRGSGSASDRERERDRDRAPPEQGAGPPGLPPPDRDREPNRGLGRLGQLGHASTAGLMSMLRPKIEFNDVPDLDTSMGHAVPSGLSITAVKVGNAGQKRRAQSHAVPLPLLGADERGERHDGGSSRPQPQDDLHPLHSYRRVHPSPPPLSPLQEMKRLEQRRRIDIMEAEHEVKMQLLRVERETADVRRRIALRDEAGAAAFTCRSCGAATKDFREINGEVIKSERNDRFREEKESALRSGQGQHQGDEERITTAGTGTGTSTATGSPVGSPCSTVTGSSEDVEVGEEESVDADADASQGPRCPGGEGTEGPSGSSSVPSNTSPSPSPSQVPRLNVNGAAPAGREDNVNDVDVGDGNGGRKLHLSAPSKPSKA